MPLTSELKDDIDRSFERLVKSISLKNKRETLSKAEDYLEEHLSRDYPVSIKEGLEKGRDLIDKANNLPEEKSQKIILAALEYLIDPWDIIPDFIAEKGFLDDIYVINQAFIRLKAATKKDEVQKEIHKLKINPEKVIQELGDAGYHFSSRAHNSNLLNSYQRRALQNISMSYLSNAELTRKQKIFYTVIIEKLIESDIFKSSCPDYPCGKCYKLKKIKRKYFN